MKSARAPICARDTREKSVESTHTRADAHVRRVLARVVTYGWKLKIILPGGWFTVELMGRDVILRSRAARVCATVAAPCARSVIALGSIMGL